MTCYDIVIIGSGPAGLTAAIYARRADKSVLILEKETFGGEITHSPKVENYPGFPVLSGNELADKMMNQALAMGAEMDMDQVLSVTKEDVFRIHGEYSDYAARSVIIAAGSKHRTLGLPGEEKLVGHGISYCAVCDGPFYKGQSVAMVGGGNSALQEAIMLSDYCRKVTIVQNLDVLTGEEKLQNILKNRPNVEILYGVTVSSLIGDSRLEALELKKESDGSLFRLDVDGAFVAIGQVPENEPFSSLVRLNERGYIETDDACRTATPGIFAAGDCRSKTIRQIVTATSDGAIAALGAIRFSE